MTAAEVGCADCGKSGLVAHRELAPGEFATCPDCTEARLNGTSDKADPADRLLERALPIEARG